MYEPSDVTPLPMNSRRKSRDTRSGVGSRLRRRRTPRSSPGGYGRETEYRCGCMKHERALARGPEARQAGVSERQRGGGGMTDLIGMMPFALASGVELHEAAP